MKRILPIKLKIARHRKGFSMDELVKRMGEASVSKMSISKMERGLFVPSEKTLQAIAQACDVPLTFFDVPEVTLSPMCFRYEKDIPCKRAKQIEAEVTLRVEECLVKEKLAAIPSMFSNPLRNLVVRTYADAELAAEKLRHHIIIGTHPLHSVYEVLQELGVIVVEIEVHTTALLGTSTVADDSQPVVIVNTYACTTTERKRFTALHELAHLLLDIRPVSEEEFHNNGGPGVTLKCPTVERLCHHFASAMLISSSSLKRRLGEHRADLTLSELISIRNMYGISIAATVHRAHDLAIISDTTYNRLFDAIISKNRTESGWGEYPIMEKADRYDLLEERLMAE